MAGDLTHAAQYRDVSREDLLELVESLLVEREDYSTAVAQL